MNDANENKKTSQTQEGDMSFDQMLEATLTPQSRITPGEKIDARVISIGQDYVFCDLGTREEGMVNKAELLEDGRITVAPGDRITVFVVGMRDGAVMCAKRLGAGDSAEHRSDNEAVLADIKGAVESGVPVQGTVSEIVKGGFRVTLMGQRAFCPISQIDRSYCDTPEAHLGQTYGFVVTQFEEGGRNIVVSRRKQLEMEAEEAAAALWEKITEGDVLEGAVSSIKGFGAFVDIGGIQGLLHVSELSYARVGDPKELLEVGQKLKVAVKEVDRAKRKISLSLKALMDDPWSGAVTRFSAGKVYDGRVVRLARFGAFVELEQGIEGLVHISEMSQERRVHNPREILSEGDTVEVRILEIDAQRRRVSLTLNTEASETYSPEQLADPSHKGMGTLGDLMNAALKKK